MSNAQDLPGADRSGEWITIDLSPRPLVLNLDPPDERTLGLSRAVRLELTAANPNGLFRDGWDLVGIWGVWIRARDEPDGLRLPGSVGEFTRYIDAYLERTRMRVRGLGNTPDGIGILNRPSTWCPSAKVLWRMARIILPESQPLPPVPEINNAEDYLYAVRVLKSAVVAGHSQSPKGGGEEQATDSEAKVVQGKKKGKDIDARMWKIVTENHEALNWSLRDWAEVLNCGPTTVQGSKTWRERIPTARAMAKAERVGSLDTSRTTPKGRRKQTHKSDR